MEATELARQIDILEYISQYTDFEQRGREYFALSPLKEENTPSFSVDQEAQIFYDFSSGIGGDIITFIEKYNDCGFSGAVEALKKYAGVTDNVEFSNNRLSAANVCKKYKLPKRSVKESTGKILPETQMELYENDMEKRKVWRIEGISDASMDRFQVRYDFMSNRLVFPIRDVDGNIINVCGRTLDPDFKEKKLRKYTYFYTFGTLNTIFGCAENRDEILRKKEIILFEGAKSVMLADGWGVKNTGALLTSHLSFNQFQILLRLGCRVVFALDSEVDVRKDESIQKLRRYLPVEVITNKDGLLADKMAPVDAGEKTWTTLYERREPL